MSRLIDADALIGPIKLQMESYDRIGACEKAEAYRNVLWEINEAPIIDAAQVVHGYWVEEPDRRNHWHCSECGFTIGVMRLQANYCPNCGAKMDKEE